MVYLGIRHPYGSSKNTTSIWFIQGYDIDMVHPNYPATEFVMEKFNESFIDEQSQQLMEEIKKIVIARKHKAFQPETNAHKAFLKTHFEKANELQLKFPFIDLKEEIEYFNK